MRNSIFSSFFLILFWLSQAASSFAHPYTDYYSWVEANFSPTEISGTAASQTGDPDFDGVSNFIEYALDRNPHSSDNQSLTVPAVGNDGHLNLTFDRISEPLDIYYIVQVSNNLIDWKTGASEVELMNSSVISTGKTRVTYRDKISSGAPDKRFMRVNVVNENTDIDGDNVPDVLEYQYYGSLTWNGSGGGTGGQDSDGDGRGDLQEQIDGTDPNNAGDFSLPDYENQKVVKLYRRALGQHGVQGDWEDDEDPGFIDAGWPASTPSYSNLELMAYVSDYYREKSEYYFKLESDSDSQSLRRSSLNRSADSASRKVEWVIIKNAWTLQETVEKISIDLFSSAQSSTYSIDHVVGSENGGEDMDNSTILGVLTPTCPVIYMFSGHDSDIVELAAPELVNQTYEWKLKDSGGAQGEFQSSGSTTWGATANSYTVKFRAGKSGSPDVQGHTRQQAPGENTIQVKLNGEILFERKIEVIEIKPRSTWANNGPDTAHMEGMQEFKRVTFHHSDRKADGPSEIYQIQQMHMRPTYLAGKGFADIAYHFVMTKDGTVYEGRQAEGLGLSGGPKTKGSHVDDNNTEAGIGICVLGQYHDNLTSGAEAFPSSRQLALEKAITAACRRYSLEYDKVSYHSAMALPAHPTVCPGDNIRAKANDIIADVKTNLE